MSKLNLNAVISGSVEAARRWIAEGDDPDKVYQTLAPAILSANAGLSMPEVSPLRSLENLLRQDTGWDPSRQHGYWTAEDYGPC